MTKRENYIKTLLHVGLNVSKKDALFISIPSGEREFALEVKKEAESIGLKDIYIFYNNLNHKDNHIAEYNEKNAKFLFFVSENKNDLNNNMVNDILNEDYGMSYTVAPIATTSWVNKIGKLSKKQLEEIIYNLSSISNEDAVKEWQKTIKANDNLISRIKNLKLNELKIYSLVDTNFRIMYNGDAIGNSNHGRMNLFPNYKLELVPSAESANGIITASNTVYVKGNKIEDLTLDIKDGEVFDYDCSKGIDIAKQVFGVNPKPVITSIGLIDNTKPTYDGVFNNIVLDRTTNPYILISSYNKELDEFYSTMVPIGCNSLKIYGTNMNGKELTIYENNEFTEKILSK